MPAKCGTTAPLLGDSGTFAAFYRYDKHPKCRNGCGQYCLTMENLKSRPAFSNMEKAEEADGTHDGLSAAVLLDTGYDLPIRR